MNLEKEKIAIRQLNISARYLWLNEMGGRYKHQRFFSNSDHDWLMRFLEHDIEDKNFLRYVKRFLKAGIMENGTYYDADTGVPQGGSFRQLVVTYIYTMS